MNIALLTAGGTGNRMGQDIPKQFMPIDNKPVIIYTMESFQKHPEIDAICVICLKGWNVVLQSYANQYNITKLKWIFDGLVGIKEAGCSDNDIVLIQDGVRPLVSQEIISNNIITCEKYGYAVTGLICKEAIMEKVDDKVHDIDIPRERLVRTQTPHTYKLGILWEAHQKAKEIGVKNTVASCTLMAAIGINDQHLVEGSEMNGLKLTRPQDVELFKALLHSQGESWMK